MIPRLFFLALIFFAVVLAGCSGELIPTASVGTPTVANSLTYDGSITLSIKNGQTLAGTNLGYQGMSADGRALLLIGKQQAAKSTLDSANYSGSPVLGTQMVLNMRVGTYDQNSVNLIGAVHLEIQDTHPQASDPAPDSITAFSIPVQYTVNKGSTIPGTTSQYLGQTTQGAEFSNLGEFPYRQALDSVVWSGHLRDKVFVRLDLRLLTFSETSATLIGPAQVRFEK